VRALRQIGAIISDTGRYRQGQRRGAIAEGYASEGRGLGKTALFKGGAHPV
jgi:hypothetical protein